MKNWNRMSSPHNPQFEKALSIYTAALPHHARLIRLAGEVLRHQDAVQAVLSPVREIAGPEVDTKLAAGRHLVDQLPVATAIFQKTLDYLLDLFQQAELMPPLSVEQRQNLLAFPPEFWLDDRSVEDFYQDQMLPAGLLLFLGHKALSPFYHQAAAPYLEKYFQAEWQKGECPSCGREPSLASLAPETGGRFLYCSLCGVQWPFSRQACAFCGDQKSPHTYFFLEDEPARRADFCKACRRYLKTIVTSRLTHALYLPLEEFITVDLDSYMMRADLIS